MKTIKTSPFKTILLLLSLSSALMSCENSMNQINGEGAIVTEEIAVKSFDGINLTGVDNVNISFGTEQKVEVTGHGNIIDRIKTNVSNGVWKIELKDGKYGKYDLSYHITLPKLNSVEASGTADITIKDTFNTDDFELNLTGTSNFKGIKMITQKSDIRITGTGSCEITATEEMDVKISGTGNVYYKGNPSINSNISGTGKLIHID